MKQFKTFTDAVNLTIGSIMFSDDASIFDTEDPYTITDVTEPDHPANDILVESYKVEGSGWAFYVQRAGGDWYILDYPY